MKDNKNRLFEIMNKVTGMPLNELDLNTYHKLQQNTSNFPYTSVYGDKKRGNKMGNINNLSKDLMKRELYKKYPIDTTTINVNGVEYKFKGIKYKSVYSMYDIYFTTDNYTDEMLIFSYGTNGYYLHPTHDKSINKDSLDDESKQIVTDILKYNMQQTNEDINRDSMYNGQQMQVKITKCDNPMYWYANYIGQTITVVPDDSRTNWSDGKEKWKVVPDNNLRGVNYVNKEDCQPINGEISENDNNMGDDIHLVDDLYASDFIGKNMRYGSPEYPMTFIPRNIEDKGNGVFEFTGDMPDATIETEGHFFTIGENELEELQQNGEVSWIGDDGAHLYLSF